MEITEIIVYKILNIKESQLKIKVLNWNVADDVTKIGINNSSNLSRLTVEYQKKSKIFKKSFIMKVPFSHPMYETGMNLEIFSREFLIYTTVLEEMYKIDGEHIGPRLYYSDEKYSIILKDLAFSGYKMKDRSKQLDYEHCRLVFIYLAKFHALSIKLEKMSKISDTIKESRPFQKLEATNQNQLLNYILTACDFLAEILECSEHKDILRKCKANYIENIMNEIYSDQKLAALNHGDCWTSNILFKCDKYGHVQKVKFIDFQFCSWGSPAYDVLFFMVTSMKFEVFEKHCDLLLEAYVSSLNKVLNFFQCETYELEDFKRDMRMPYCLFFLLSTVLVQYVSSPSDPWNSRDFLKNGVFDADYGKIHFENQNYQELAKKWFLCFLERGWFDDLKIISEK